MTTTVALNASLSTNASSRRVVKASSIKNIVPFATLKKHLGAPALLAGFAAAQVTFFNPGPALAEIAAPTYTPKPSVDLISQADAVDIVSEIEDQEIPQLQVKLGQLASTGNESTEAVAAAEVQLQAIEREAALLAENGSPAEDITAKTGGLLSEIGALKSMMRGMSQ